MALLGKTLPKDMTHETRGTLAELVPASFGSRKGRE